MTNAQTRLKDALASITDKSDAIRDMAYDRSNELSSIFSERGNAQIIGICIELAKAVAACSDMDIENLHDAICTARDHTADANAILAGRMTRNPLFMSLVDQAEMWVFAGLLEDQQNIINYARLIRPLLPFVRRALLAGFTDIRQQIETHENRTLKVEIVKPPKPPSGCNRRGKSTDYMKKQRETMQGYLRTHPVCASYSVIDRARQCWAEHQAEWDRAAADKTGYASYKTLAQTA